MSTEMTTADLAKLPAHLRAFFEDEAADDLSEGVSGGFAVVSLRGGKWRVKHRGEETPITKTDEDGDAIPVPNLDVVIIKASPNVSKIWYEKKYSEGDDAAPDCFSTDGIKPDPSSVKPQCGTCAACPKNVFGSRITEDGKKAKACGDSRRLAVLPLHDLDNEMLGGPMLLRVPAASLGDLATYGSALKAAGFDYRRVGTRISFDMTVAYPKLVFKPRTKHQFSMEDLMKIAEAGVSDQVARILEEAPPVHDAAPAAAEPKPQPAAAKGPDLASTFGDDDDDDEPPVTTKPKTNGKAKPKANGKATKAAPVEEDEDENPAPEQEEEEIGGLLSSLRGLE